MLSFSPPLQRVVRRIVWWTKLMLSLFCGRAFLDFREFFEFCLHRPTKKRRMSPNQNGERSDRGCTLIEGWSVGRFARRSDLDSDSKSPGNFPLSLLSKESNEDAGCLDCHAFFRKLRPTR